MFQANSHVTSGPFVALGTLPFAAPLDPPLVSNPIEQKRRKMAKINPCLIIIIIYAPAQK